MIAYCLLCFIFASAAFAYANKTAFSYKIKPAHNVFNIKDTDNAEDIVEMADASPSPLKRVAASRNLIALGQVEDDENVAIIDSETFARQLAELSFGSPSFSAGGLPVTPPPSLAGTESDSDDTTFDPEDLYDFRRSALKFRRRGGVKFYISEDE